MTTIAPEHLPPDPHARRTESSADAQRRAWRDAAAAELRERFTALVGPEWTAKFTEVHGEAGDGWERLTLVWPVGTGRRVEAELAPMCAGWRIRGWRPAVPSMDGHWCGTAGTAEDAVLCLRHAAAWAGDDANELAEVERAEEAEWDAANVGDRFE